MNGESLFIMWRLSKWKSNDIQTQGVGLRSASKVKNEIMNYEIVLLLQLHQSVQETLMMGANSGRHQEEEMKVPTRKEKESLLRRYTLFKYINNNKMTKYTV